MYQQNFQGWNRQSRRDQYNRGQNYNNFERNTRSRSATRFPNTNRGQAPYRGWRNDGPRGRRSRSCDPARRYGYQDTHHKQRPFSTNFQPMDFQPMDIEPWYDFHRHHPPPNVYNKRGSRGRLFSQHHTAKQGSHENDHFMDYSTNNQHGNYENYDQQMNYNVKNTGVPIPPITLKNAPSQECEDNATNKNAQNPEERKLWVFGEGVSSFFKNNVSKDLQHQARAALALINNVEIKKIVTVHCQYCSIRCRSTKEMESHKATKRHIKIRHAYLKKWCQGI